MSGNSMLAFVLGLGIGGAVSWYYAKKKYEQLAEEEIDSVKKAFSKKNIGDEDIDFKLKNILKKENYTNYSDYIHMKKNKTHTDNNAVINNEENNDKMIEIIPPDMFGEMDNYDQISLTYYADGVLADEDGNKVENIQEKISDAFEHFGEWEDDSVFVRNHIYKCDYEILKDERDFFDAHPPRKPHLIEE